VVSGCRIKSGMTKHSLFCRRINTEAGQGFESAIGSLFEDRPEFELSSDSML
jgi:hypothetical protein